MSVDHRGVRFTSPHDSFLARGADKMTAEPPVVVNATPPQQESSGSSGEDELGHSSTDESSSYPYAAYAPASTVDSGDEVAPLRGPGEYSWNATRQRAREMSSIGGVGPFENPPPIQTQTNGMSSRAARPSAVRTPSNAYAPARRPEQFSLNTNSRHGSSTGRGRRNPNAEYRAQEKAYVQRIRQENEQDDFFNDIRTPSLGQSG
jgi:mitogen-activated protein kinase kinase kinase